MDDKKPKRSNQETSEEFQRFEDVASRIFQVPIEEVRELEKKRSDKAGGKKSKDKT